ncbi:hypothetical protein [Streptomyces sp. NPDC051219]|uniref:hypothetical protein n=1 Tax=Streptomyces sp. NPDC051219 TaxID=3155283 RepID=UPI00343A72D1
MDREALSRFTESAGHVPPGRWTPGVTTSVRRAPERNDEGRDGDPAECRPAVLGEAWMRIAVKVGYKEGANGAVSQ